MILFKKIAESGKYHDDLAIHDVLTYITRKDKTPSGNVFCSHESMPHIIDSMISVSMHYGKYSKIRLHHFILTFKPNDAAFLPLIAVALIYLAMVMILSRLVTLLERRLAKNDKR